MLKTRSPPATRSGLLRSQCERPSQPMERSDDLNKRPCLSIAAKRVHEKAHVRGFIKKKLAKAYNKPKSPMWYSCKECDEQFISRRNLNEHKKTHIKRIVCTVCHKTFRDRMEFELHDAIYDGKNYQLFNTPAHRTRSRSRLSCYQHTAYVGSCDASFFNDSMTVMSEITSKVFSRNSSRSRTIRRASGISKSLRFPTPKKSKLVKDWIENNQHLSDEAFDDSVSATPGFSVSPALTRWSSQQSFTILNRFICSEDQCMHTYACLNLVTIHEQYEHNKLILFRCEECRKRFTTRGNLQIHRINTHTDVMICVLCDSAQRGFAAIEEHFKLHQKYSVKCNVCSKIFLNRYCLEEHLKKKALYHKNYMQTKATILIYNRYRDMRKLCAVNSVLETPQNNPLSDLRFCHELDDNSTSISFDDNLPWRYY